MSDIKQLEKFINSSIAQLVTDGNEKALQKLSVIADAEVSGKALDMFEGKAMDLLLQIAANQNAAKMPAFAPAACPINLGEVTDSLTWRGTIDPGALERVELMPQYQPYVLPRHWRVDAPSTVTIESVRSAGAPLLSGTISAAVFRGEHLSVNWPVVRARGLGAELEIEFQNHGSEPADVYTELLCEACTEPNMASHGYPASRQSYGLLPGGGGTRYRR